MRKTRIRKVDGWQRWVRLEDYPLDNKTNFYPIAATHNDYI